MCALVLALQDAAQILTAVNRTFRDGHLADCAAVFVNDPLRAPLDQPHDHARDDEQRSNHQPLLKRRCREVLGQMGLGVGLVQDIERHDCELDPESQAKES